MEVNELTRIVIGCAIEVHRTLGPGLLESVYEECLAYELGILGIRFNTQVPLIANYKGAILKIAYRIDFVIEGVLLLELKSVENILRVHYGQVLTYLKMSGLQTGLLINFNSTLLRSGIKRFRI